jgi:hypothetical protein
MNRSCRPSVGVVVLNHNGRLLAERCLSSVVRAGYPGADLIAVDNNSTDGSVAYLTERFPDATVLASPVNLGVTGGRNLGFREAMRRGHDYILSLDSDARIDVSLIEELVAVAEADPRIGVVGPKTYNDDESRTIQCVGGRILWTENVTRERGAGEPDRGQYDTVTDVDYIPGFGFMARRDVFELLDALDETFEGYGHEDTDFCLRAKQFGYRIVYAPRAVLWHKGSATIGGYSPRRKYLEAVNSVLLVRRYGTLPQRIKYATYAGGGLIYALGVQAPRGNAKAVWAKARGLWRGAFKPLTPAPAQPLNVLWLIDHVCYDGNLHGGGRLYMNLLPRFDPALVRIHPYFLRASDEVRQLFADAGHPVRTLDIGKYDPTGPLRIAALCRQHHIDVMHLCCYASSTLGRIVGAVKGIPSVLHDFDTQVYFGYPLYLKILDRLLASRTDHAFAASAYCKEYMRDVRRIPGDRIEVLYHAVPESLLELRPRLDRAGARASVGLRDELVFCVVTKLGPERGNETLLKAFAKVRQARPDARLVLVYQPTLYHRLPKEYESIPWARDPVEMRARIERVIAELNLSDSVRMVESTVHPEAWYAASDVMIAPFESIRFSSVHLVEGMAYGRPHVVTALGEPLELVQLYGGGVAVPAGDVEAMAGAMLAIGNDPVLRSELGRKARLGAEELTVDAVAARLSRLYRSLHERAPR